MQQLGVTAILACLPSAYLSGANMLRQRTCAGVVCDRLTMLLRWNAAAYAMHAVRQMMHH
jgi:hypothetical protein